MRGGAGGWEGTCSQWPWQGVYAVHALHHLSLFPFLFYFPAINQQSCASWPSSARLLLIHRLWEQRQNSPPFWGMLKSFECLLRWFSFLISERCSASVNTTWLVEHFPCLFPPSLLDWNLFPPSPPGCDSTCQLGTQMFFSKTRQLIEKLAATKDSFKREKCLHHLVL